MNTFIQSVQDLETYLAPMGLDEEECIVFALDGFHSRLAMEMLQIRMRKQGQIFDLSGLVPCMVSIPERALRVSRTAIQTLNRQLADRIICDPVSQIAVMRNFVICLEVVREASQEIESPLELTRKPTAIAYLRYVEAVTNYQSLDTLKFSLKIEEVKQALQLVPGMDHEWREDLCRPP